MIDTAGSLNEKLRKVRKIVDRCAHLSLCPETLTRCEEALSDITEKIEVFTEQTLTVGILGGTGVGKSSLMNALAGSRISSTDHRRPHTDAILIYRFSETPIPEKLAHSAVEWHDIIHDAEEISQILLCDLPDFDSALDAHRDRVIGFIDHLDLLIWMVSPEKYGDARFYDFLRSVPKAKNNFLFVLNKVDIFFDGTGDTEGPAELRKVMERFETYLVQNGIDIERAYLYAVCARETCARSGTSSWNQMPALRGEIFRQRESREVRTIKSSNIEADIRDLVKILRDKTAPLDSMEQALSEVIALLEGNAHAFEDNVARFASSAAARQARESLRDEVADRTLLVGPTAVIHSAAIHRLKRPPGPDGVNLSMAMETTVAEVEDFFARQFKSLDDRTDMQMIRHGASASSAGRRRDEFYTQHQREKTRETLLEIFRLSHGRKRTAVESVFKFLQYAVYLAVTILFIFSLGGRDATRHVIEEPGLKSIVSFIVEASFALFSLHGVAALTGFVIINGILAYRFYVRYRKIVERRIDGIIEKFAKRTGLLWTSLLEKRIASLVRTRDHIVWIRKALDEATGDRREAGTKGNT